MDGERVPKETAEGYDVKLDDETVIQVRYVQPTPDQLLEKQRENAIEFTGIKLQAEFKRLTEHSEEPGKANLWDASPSAAARAPEMNLFALDDFMWMVYTVHGLLKLWELYDVTFGEQDRPFLRKMITQFIDRRTRIELLKEETPGE